MIEPHRIALVAYALDELPPLVTRLQLELTEPANQAGNGTRTPPTSRPPLPLDVVSDLEEAWNAITTWVRDWCDVLDLRGPATWTWITTCGWLGAQWPNAAERHPAADDFADELIYRRDRDDPPGIRSGWLHVLRRHEADKEHRTWRPLPGRWACPVILDNGLTCGTRLLEHASERIIRCPNCTATWAGDAEYERLGLMLGCDLTVTIEQAAVLAKVHVSTIYRWNATGTLPIVNGLVDKRDLALIAVRRA